MNVSIKLQINPNFILFTKANKGLPNIGGKYSNYYT